MKNTILTIILALITTTAFSQKIANVAIIYPFDLSKNIDNAHEIFLQSELTKKIISVENYSAFTRTDINAIIDEHHFQETGMVKDDERQKIGDMTGATHICVSKFENQNENVIITAKIIVIETGEIIAEANCTPDKEYFEQYFDAIHDCCRALPYRLKLPIVTNYSVIFYNKINEAIDFINERILKVSITIDNEGLIWIGGALKFEISKVIFSYYFLDFRAGQHQVKISCKKGKCIKWSYGSNLKATFLECRTKKDAQDVIKAFQFIQSQF